MQKLILRRRDNKYFMGVPHCSLHVFLSLYASFSLSLSSSLLKKSNLSHEQKSQQKILPLKYIQKLFLEKKKEEKNLIRTTQKFGFKQSFQLLGWLRALHDLVFLILLRWWHWFLQRYCLNMITFEHYINV